MWMENQMEKNKNYVISLLYEISNKKETKKQNKNK